MGHVEKCIIRPDLTVDEAQDAVNLTWAAPEKKKYVDEKRLYHFQIEFTSKCAGSCIYCYSSSDNVLDHTISKEKLKEIVDIGVKMGVREIGLDGGDATAHPDWYEVASYIQDKGMLMEILPAGMVSKKTAKQLASLPFATVCHHLDSLNPDVYNKVHLNPRTRELRIKGYHNLLEAGVPAERIIPIITLTRHSAQTVEETFDWFVDEMGATFICMTIFRSEGFGSRFHDLEPSMTDIRKAYEYRVKKLGEHWRKIGTTDGSRYLCQGYVSIRYDGDIGCCAAIRDFTFGNIYKDDLQKVVERNREMIMFDFPIEGACGSCQNEDLCFGCRANAYHYTGKLNAADPRCPWNPENPEFIPALPPDKKEGFNPKS